MEFNKYKLFNYKQLPIYLIKNSLHDIKIDTNLGKWKVFMDLPGGWGNGYVGIPKWHPFYKKDYSELNKYINIHGGLTFSDFNEDKSLWVIGFDTNHYNDNMYNFPYDFVLNETKYLREQCLKLKEVQRILKLNKINNKLLKKTQHY